MDSLVTLPPAQVSGGVPVEQALDRRHTCREFSPAPLTLGQVGQLLWSAQGANSRGRRTAPSAGARYPLETYAVTADGVGQYDPDRHRLRWFIDQDSRGALARAALDQEFVAAAPLTIVLCAVYERVNRKYGEARGPRYVHIEVGHAAQNVLLQAVCLGLGAAPVGAFDDEAVQLVLRLPDDHQPLYLLPIGYPARRTD